MTATALRAYADTAPSGALRATAPALGRGGPAAPRGALHLAALAGPLQGAARTLDPHGCGPITAADLGKLFPDAPLRRLDGLAAELTAQQHTGKIDTPARRAHFFGQVRQEVGSDGRLDENLNYSPAGLKALFSYFAKHPAEAELYGRTDKHPAHPEAIANRAYANRNGNGDVASGDGWLFRGRGLKQLTGRANYRAFTQTHARLFGERIDFEKHPEKLSEPRYAVRSALAFWLDNGLPAKADAGITRAAADSITAVVNLHTDSYAARWSHVQRIARDGLFGGECAAPRVAGK